MPPPVPVLFRGADEIWRAEKRSEQYEVVGALPRSPYPRHVKGSPLSDLLTSSGVEYVASVREVGADTSYYAFYYLNPKKGHALMCIPSGYVNPGGPMSKLGPSLPRGMVMDSRISSRKKGAGSPVSISKRSGGTRVGGASAAASASSAEHVLDDERDHGPGSRQEDYVDCVIDSKALVMRAMDTLAGWGAGRVPVSAPDSVLDDVDDPPQVDASPAPYSSVAAVAAAAAAAAAAAGNSSDEEEVSDDKKEEVDPVKDEVMEDPVEKNIGYMPNGPLIMDFMGYTVTDHDMKKLVKNDAVMARCASTLLCASLGTEGSWTTPDGKKTLSTFADVNGFMLEDSSAGEVPGKMYSIRDLPDSVSSKMSASNAISAKGIASEGGRKALITFVKWAVRE